MSLLDITGFEILYLSVRQYSLYVSNISNQYGRDNINYLLQLLRVGF